MYEKSIKINNNSLRNQILSQHYVEMFFKSTLTTVPSPTCHCGEKDQTTEHVLQRCNRHQPERIAQWPSATPLHQKLYGGWRTWRRPPTLSLLLDWLCKPTRRRRRTLTTKMYNVHLLLFYVHTFTSLTVECFIVYIYTANYCDYKETVIYILNVTWSPKAKLY